MSKHEYPKNAHIYGSKSVQLTLSASVIFNQITFHQIDTILSQTGGILVILNGVLTLIVARLVKGKWFVSLIRAINTKKYGEDREYS